MKKSKFSEEQIAYALRQADSGTPVGEVCRQLGVSEATFYVWKKKYGQLGLSELREMRQLRDENARLKRLVADLTLDKHILSEVLRKKSLKPARRWQLVAWIQETFQVSTVHSCRLTTTARNHDAEVCLLAQSLRTAVGRTAPAEGRAQQLGRADADHMSVCSASSSASSTSMPRYLTVASSLPCPSSGCTARRFFVRR